jgi:hypothetical protein
VFRPSSQNATSAERVLVYRKFEESVDNDEDDHEDNDEGNDGYHSWLWPMDCCAIYHQFDVENGKSLWMMTTSQCEGNQPPPGATLSEVNVKEESMFRDVKNVRYSVDVLSECPLHERFKASLSVLLWLADWSLSEYGQYINMLDDDLEALVNLSKQTHPPPTRGGPQGKSSLH